MDYRYLMKVILGRKLFLILIPILCAAITFSIIYLKGKNYLSKAQLATGITDQDEVSITQTETNWNVLNNKFNNFLEFLNSKEIYQFLSYKLLLHDLENPSPFRKLTDSQAKQLDLNQVKTIQKMVRSKYDSLKAMDTHTQLDQTLNEWLKVYGYDQKSLKKTLSINRLSASDFIKIEAKTENSYLSAFMVNAFCEEVIRFYNHTENQRSGNSVAFFKDLMLKKKAEMEAKMDSLKNFKKSSKLVNYTVQSQSKLDQIAALELNQNEELKKIASIQTALRQINSQLNQKEKETGENIHSNNKILLTQTRINKMLNRYYNSGMSDKKLSDSIAVLRDYLERQIALFNTGNAEIHNTSKQDLISKKLNYEIELSMAQANVKSITPLLSSLKSSITGIVSDENTFSALEMAANVAREEYLMVLDKYNVSKNLSLNNGALLRQVEFGQPADEPESSHILTLTAASAFAGFLLTLLALVGLVWVDNSIKNPSNLEKVARMPVLGTLYNYSKKALSIKELIEKNLTGSSAALFREQLRTLRFEITKSGGKIFLFTSTEEGTGKSFVLLSAAYSLSLNNKKVIIIDTNFKNNTLSRLYENTGMESYMETIPLLPATQSSSRLPEETLKSNRDEYFSRDIIKNTSFENVDIIGCRGNGDSPSEIFLGDRFHLLLNNLSIAYDYILLEGSALNTYADSKELAEYADKVIAVFSASSTIRDADEVSLKFLRTLEGKLLGSVLNNVATEI